MKPSFRHMPSRFGMFALVLLAGAGVASAQVGSTPPTIQDGTIGRGEINPPQWRLTETQRSAIAAAVRARQEGGRAVDQLCGGGRCAGAAGDRALHLARRRSWRKCPRRRAVKYTVMKNQLVLVDPTTMRVVDIIPHTLVVARSYLARSTASVRHRRRQGVEIRPHEERLAGAVAEIAVVGIDHRAHRADAARHRRDDDVAEFGVRRLLAEARIGGDGAGDAFGRRPHQHLHRRVLLLQRQAHVARRSRPSGRRRR